MIRVSMHSLNVLVTVAVLSDGDRPLVEEEKTARCNLQNFSVVLKTFKLLTKEIAKLHIF